MSTGNGSDNGEGIFEEDSDTLVEGMGRRDLFRIASAVGVGAALPTWLGAGVAGAAPRSVTRELEMPFGRRPGRILQPGQGPGIRGRYIRATEQTVLWGHLPNRDTPPIATVNSGALVTFDTVSHEGVLDDQGRNPVQYFGAHGVPRRGILRDAIAIAESSIEHDFVRDGPHLVVGPVHVRGAEPGDVLRIDVVSITPRVPYGVVSNRHGKGALAGEFPESVAPDPEANAENPERFRNVSIFTPVRRINGRDRLVMPAGPRHTVQFPLSPFFGTMGVALNTSERVNSVPPTRAAGNLDIGDLGEGSTLYVPVFVRGAKFFVSDPHFSQGNGEIALTAIEGSLRGTFRLTVLKRGSRRIPGNRETLEWPFGENPNHWIPIGLDPDLDEAMKIAAREAVEFLHGEFDMPRAVALGYLSAASDFNVSQVVDRTKGIHALIRKSDFIRRSSAGAPRHAG